MQRISLKSSLQNYVFVSRWSKLKQLSTCLTLSPQSELNFKTTGSYSSLVTAHFFQTPCKAFCHLLNESSFSHNHIKCRVLDCQVKSSDFITHTNTLLKGRKKDHSWKFKNGKLDMLILNTQTYESWIHIARQQTVFSVLDQSLGAGCLCHSLLLVLVFSLYVRPPSRLTG